MYHASKSRPNLTKGTNLSAQMKLIPHPHEVRFFLTVNCQQSTVNFF